MQQSFSYNKKLILDINKKEKFDCPVFHIFLLSDVENVTGEFDEILKYGSKKKATFEEYSEIYPKEKLEIIGFLFQDLFKKQHYFSFFLQGYLRIKMIH